MEQIYLYKSDDRWVWHGGYETRHLPKTAKFFWSPSDRCWWTNDIEKAILLIDYSEGGTYQELLAHKQANEQRLLISSANDMTIDIPVPDGKEYYGYQKAGIAYALNNSGTLIADEMGLGKSIQAIGVINARPDIKHVIITCPASLKYNWRHELRSWLVRDYSIEIISPGSKPSNADIIIINYDILQKHQWLFNRKFDLIIADEAHYVKNKKAKRSASYYKLAKGIPKKIMLTGTPILNKPVELFYIIESLGFTMNYWAYVKRYCDLKEGSYAGWDVSGASNLEELQLKLRQSIMVRRTKADVLPELPPKRRQIICLDPTKYTHLIEAEQDFLGKFEDMFLTDQDDGEINSYEAEIIKLRAMTPSDIAEMSKLRHATARAKVPDVINHINELLETTDKVVLFAHHRDVIDAIHQAFMSDAVVLVGGMSPQDKDNTVQRFQNDDRVRLFIGSIHAAGVGLTLTAASIAVFAELDWVPANVLQAEDRIHRIGQQESVIIQYLVIDGSMDATIAKRIIDKQNVIDRALMVDRIQDMPDKIARQVHAAGQLVEMSRETAERKMFEKPMAVNEVHNELLNGIPQYDEPYRHAIMDNVREVANDPAKLARIEVTIDRLFITAISNHETLSNAQVQNCEKILKKYGLRLVHMQ